MSELARRDLIIGAAFAAAATSMAASANAQTPTGLVPTPLPFDPKAIKGLSEKLLVSHHDNNYAGAVARIGAITGQLAQLDMNTAAGFLVNGLKREEIQ